MEQWALVEYTFHLILGIDLERAWHRKTYRWFMVRLGLLLTTDTPLARYFAPEAETPPEGTPNG